MSERDASSQSVGEPKPYVVVARRYRPLSFDELVGQQHISTALTNAIETNRVGHAYLFTGARGVGKTSTARIFAKALNAPDGPTARPDNSSDICQAIDAGEDVDVLEIDGASNRGIDEIRQLRSNANIRPSRARYKIYIIDEVHMLTQAAFNALLKTLEEPPEHVKFIFCTTDPQKMPITVLSRCQRFDFAPVDAESIVDRLKLIVTTEGREADDAALDLLAKRASGSMRDSQSLLEQLLSFSSGTITASDVHQMLGTADSGRLAELVRHLIARDAAESIRALDTAVVEGVDCGQFAEQVLGYFRDLMAVAVGCSGDLLHQTGAGDFPSLKSAAGDMGLPTILAAAQVLDQALVRMRQSTDPRILLEIAIVQICNLDDLTRLSDLVDAIQTGGGAGSPPAKKTSERRVKSQSDPSIRGGAGSAEKKTNEITDSADSSSSLPQKTHNLCSSNVASVWKQVIDSMEDMTADFASYYDSIAISAPDCVAVRFSARYTLQKESCEQPDRKSRLEKAISDRVGRKIRIEFQVIRDSVPAPKGRTKSRFQQMREKEDHPLVRQAIDLFGAEVTRVEMPREDK